MSYLVSALLISLLLIFASPICQKYRKNMLYLLSSLLTLATMLITPATAACEKSMKDVDLSDKDSKEAFIAAMDKRMAETEALFAKLRETDDPSERMKIMQEHRKSMQESMPERPQYKRMRPRAYPGQRYNYSRGPYQRWQPMPRTDSPAADTAAPQSPPPAAPDMEAHRTRMMESIHRQMEIMREQMERQQKVMDDIMKYRAPIEEMLKKQSTAVPKIPGR